MAPSASSKMRNAPYSKELPQAPGWNYCVKGLDALFYDHPALDNERLTFYVSFGFMNDKPYSIGQYIDPPEDYSRSHFGAPVDIFRIIRDAYEDLIADGPFHEAIFRYRKNEGWAVAHFYDEAKNQWDIWRERRAELDILRYDWFARSAHSDGFDCIEELNLYVLLEQENGMHEIVPVLVGWAEKDVWMMTSGFTNPPNPRDDKKSDVSVCNIELLFRCSRASLEKANSVEESPEYQAITLMAEAFYWKYIDPDNVPPIDLSEPVRLTTLAEYSGQAHALAPATPFFLSAAQNDPIDLASGQEFVPAFVTVERAIGRKLNPALSAKLHSWTGSLGKAPRKFTKPSDLDLVSLLREELEKGDGIQSPTLLKRMENYACLEFYYGRTLPADLAPYLAEVYLVELGESNWRNHVQRLKEWGDHDPELDGDQYPLNTALDILAAYEGLRTIDLRQSDIENLGWLAAVPWIETLLLSGTKIQDFSELVIAQDLVYLDLAQTELNDLAPLAKLSKLEKLSLMQNPVSDLSPLASMTQLKELTLRNMPSLELSPIASLYQLEKLSLEGQSIKDFSFLKRCKNIRWLSLAGSDIEDLSILPDLPELEELYLHGAYNVSDLSSLRRFSKLLVINASGTAVKDWGPVENVKKVTGRP